MNDEMVEPSTVWDSFIEAVLVAALVGLAVLALRGSVTRFGDAAKSRAAGRWVSPVGYVVGLGAGAGLGAWLVSPVALGVVLGLAGSVVAPSAIAAVRLWFAGRGQAARRVPRKPGHNEDV